MWAYIITCPVVLCKPFCIYSASRPNIYSILVNKKTTKDKII